MIRHRLSTGVVSVALVVCTGCDYFPNDAKIGVSGDPSAIRIHYLLCLREVIISVRLDRVDEERTVPLWGIRARDWSTETVFIVGRTPPGFTERMPLSAMPDANDTLLAVVQPNSGTAAALEFPASGLRSDRVVTHGQRDGATPAEFEKEARASCG